MTKPKHKSAKSAFVYDKDDFKKRLLAEYDLLQKKADTIGGFRITIKGWSVVALGGAAAASAKLEPGAGLLLSGGLAILLGIFYRLEFEQVRLSSLYMARAGRIERTLISVDLGRGAVRQKRMPVPYTANDIVFAKRDKVYAEGDSKWQVAKRTHPFLYAILILLALLIGGPSWLKASKAAAAMTKRVYSSTSHANGSVTKFPSSLAGGK